MYVYIYIGELSGLGFRPQEYLIAYIPIWGGSTAISPKPLILNPKQYGWLEGLAMGEAAQSHAPSKTRKS